MRYLLDANAHQSMKNHPVVLQHLAAAAPGDCVIPSIARYELFVGVEKSADPAKERAKVSTLIKGLRQRRFGSAAAEEAARIRAYLEALGTPIGPYDTLLAGHALSLSLVVVTANVTEFGRVPGLTVENWQV